MILLESSDSLDRIANAHQQHARASEWWKATNAALFEDRPEMQRSLSADKVISVGPLGGVSFTFVEMGAINSLDLFGLDELILFSFYWRNRSRYRAVVDLGANLGLHSVILARMGMTVTAYEPDPRHVENLRAHLVDNEVQDRVRVREVAVTSEGGVVEFVRVLGNTTGSHVAGAKDAPYGDLERFAVPSERFAQAVRGADLVKMDVEGLEADLLCSVTPEELGSVDVLCEVGSVNNAQRIWDHFSNTQTHLFTQKCNWEIAKSPEDLPTSHRDGSLFISSQAIMPWGSD